MGILERQERRNRQKIINMKESIHWASSKLKILLFKICYKKMKRQTRARETIFVKNVSDKDLESRILESRTTYKELLQLNNKKTTQLKSW